MQLRSCNSEWAFFKESPSNAIEKARAQDL